MAKKIFNDRRKKKVSTINESNSEKKKYYLKWRKKINSEKRKKVEYIITVHRGKKDSVTLAQSQFSA